MLSKPDRHAAAEATSARRSRLNNRSIFSFALETTRNFCIARNRSFQVGRINTDDQYSPESIATSNYREGLSARVENTSIETVEE